MKYGTSYFVSRASAIRYYSQYGLNTDDVDRKIQDTEIIIGRPPLGVSDTLHLIDDGTRYAVEYGKA